MNNLAPINDINLKIFDEIAEERFSEIGTDCLLIIIIDNLPPDALPHLAEQYHITGNEGWLQCQSDSEKRALIKKAIELHRYKGTKYALIKVLNSLNINGEIQEWFEYNGEPYHFKISIFLKNCPYNEKVFDSLKKMIDEYKNVRSVLEEISIESQFDAVLNWATYTNAENEIRIG